MRNVLASTVFVAGLLIGAPASAGDTPPGARDADGIPIVPMDPETGAAVGPGITDDTLVCKYQVEIGSHFTRRICRTQRAWKAIHDASRDAMDYTLSGRGTRQAGEGG